MRELSQAEWNVMESLWQEAPKIGSRIVADLSESVGWSRSTSLTMLKRMVDKGLIACVDGDGIKKYRPLVDRKEAVTKETKSFLDRVYKGSISMMLSAFTKESKLSAKEIEELQQILDNAKIEGKGEEA